MAALAVAEPSFAASALQDSMDKLSAACQRLSTGLASPIDDALSGTPVSGAGPTRGTVPEAVKRTINSVHGYALGAAALLGASTRCAAVREGCCLTLTAPVPSSSPECRVLAGRRDLCGT